MESRQWGQFMSVRMSEAQAKAILGKHYTAPQNMPQKRQKPTKQRRSVSSGESVLALQLRAQNVPFSNEFKFCDSRRWRSDFRVLDTRILIEVEGGTWSGGRHTRGKGYEQDCEKYNWAAANGWTVLRYTTGQVKSGLALQGVLAAIGEESVDMYSNTLMRVVRVVGEHHALRMVKAKLKDFVAPEHPSKDSSLALLIGLDNVKKLAAEFGGETIHLPSQPYSLTQLRNDKICAEYLAGFSITNIAITYGLDRKAVQKILDVYEMRGKIVQPSPQLKMEL